MFWDKIIERIIQPITKPFKDKLDVQDRIIKVQQEKIGSTPQHFAVPFGMGSSQNINVRPTRKRIKFSTLRALSESYDVLRACINRRKREVEGVKWWIGPIDEEEKGTKYQKQIEQVTEFFETPGGKFANFREFTNEIVEDLLVFDGATIWKDKARGGDLLKLITVDTSTIRLRVMEDGSTPEPPKKAYEQWIRGSKVAAFTADRICYLMMNPRSNTPYGLSPIESLIIGIDAALRSQLYNLSLLTEGNVPEGFLSVPEIWTPKQIEEFQLYFDTLIAGNPRRQQKIKLIPGGTGVGYTPTKKSEDMKFLEYEKWLLLKVCALYNIPPNEIGYTDKIPKASAEVQSEIAMKFGLRPTLMALKECFDSIIKDDFGYSDIEFKWQSLDKEDRAMDAEINERYINIGVKSVDEVRQENDLDAIGLGHYVKTPKGPVLVDDILNPKEELEEEEPEEKEEIEETKVWKKKALGDIKHKRKFRIFKTDKINHSVKKLIEARLLFAKTKDEVKDIFNEQIDIMKKDLMIGKVSRLKEGVLENLRK